MDEYIDLLNEDGERTGKTCLKSEAHKNGLYHASAHIWIFDKNKKVLIQKRAANKDTFPNLWDISVAGHISAGELPINSALREVKEEVGITISKNDLTFIGTSKKKVIHNVNLIDNELHYIYVCKIDFKIASLKIQKEEVAEITSIDIDKLFKIINTKNNNFVPHGNDYYNFVLTEIKNYNCLK